jgi:DNA-binding ferritin-like protein (Dps family)
MELEKISLSGKLVMMVLPEDVRVFLDELFSDERPSFLPPFLPNSEKSPRCS